MSGGRILSELEKVVGEIYSSEKKFLDDLIEMRVPVREMQAMNNKKASQDFYSLVDEMIFIAEEIRKKFPNDLNGIIKKNVNARGVTAYDIDEIKFREYLSEIKKLFDVSKRLSKNPADVANFTADCKSAKDAALIDLEQKQNFPLKIITPAQRLPRYELLFKDAIKRSSSVQVGKFENALNLILPLLGDEKSQKSKSTFSRDELMQIMHGLEVAAYDQSVEKKDRKFYLAKIIDIKSALRDNKLNVVCDLLFQVSERARESEDRVISGLVNVLSDAFNNQVNEMMENPNWVPPPISDDQLKRLKIRASILSFIDIIKNDKTNGYANDAERDGYLLDVIQRHIYTSKTLDEMIFGLNQAMSPSRAESGCSEEYKQAKKSALAECMKHFNEAENIKTVRTDSVTSLRKSRAVLFSQHGSISDPLPKGSPPRPTAPLPASRVAKQTVKTGGAQPPQSPQQRASEQGAARRKLPPPPTPSQQGHFRKPPVEAAKTTPPPFDRTRPLPKSSAEKTPPPVPARPKPQPNKAASDSELGAGEQKPPRPTGSYPRK